ncbi:hypothetical protein [Pseudogemmobacter bohemicus]|uniref:hypothetical protein n=1 Tax=Pseudogemmobacter bohemicus TaxID=2250708 RepID=UPI0013002E73|nr:hypothetical protein [Pseudogemmobacter bohemicus]
MPRGGTTAVGNIFNAPRTSYCYAAESHWLPLMSEFAGRAAMPDFSAPIVRRILEDQNHSVLYEMPRFSVTRGAHPRALIFDEADLGPLADQLMEALGQGQSGEKLHLTALAILRAHIFRKTGRRYLGEKTPSNIFAFRDLGTLGARAAISVTREPFAVLRSMRKRAADAGDANNGPFRWDFYRLLGIWLEYAGCMQALKGRPVQILLRYEDILQAPGRVTADLFRATGVSSGWLERRRARIRLRERSPRQAWSGFSGHERALLLALTRDLRLAQGYGDDFYAADGMPLAPAAPQLPSDGVMPVWGVNPRAESEPVWWLMREGCLALHSTPDAGSLALHFWCNFPLSVVGTGEVAVISLTDPASGAEIARAEVAGGFAGSVPVMIDLTRLAPLLEGGGGAVRLVNFRASHAFRGYLTEAPDRPGEVLSHDRREVSFALVT